MNQARSISRVFLLFWAGAFMLTGCSSLRGNGLPAGQAPTALQASTGKYPATLTPFQPEGFTPPPTETATPLPGQPTNTPFQPSLWIGPAVPAVLSQVMLTSGIPQAANFEQANLILDVQPVQSSAATLQASNWIYALVSPFPTLTDDVTLTELQAAWTGASSGPFSGRPLWMDASTLAAFTALWGSPASSAVSLAPEESLLDSAWAAQPAWAIVPFEDLGPRWKVLSVDGQSPVHNDFDQASYPLKINFALQSSAAGAPSLDLALPASNRDPQKLTVLAMTGTTALVRATADRMEKHGFLYPGEEVRSVLRAADLTHVSNEVSFDPACPTPDPWTDSLQFCSNPAYIALLEDVGVDIVELTGNHLVDYGPADLLNTIDMYDQRGWLHFGGGRDLADATRPVTVTDHGNKLAFLGCNIAGPPNDWATDSRPGSAPCDFDQMHAEIASLRSEGVLPIVTFQYNEYYQSTPTDYEVTDFRSMAEEGAVVVSGSQSHMPATMEFDGSTFIHYGLGNLFFDQMSHLMPDGTLIYDTRNVFIDRHVIYDGKYIGTELLTYIIEDYSRPRLMTGAERTRFLQSIFRAGGW